MIMTNNNSYQPFTMPLVFKLALCADSTASLMSVLHMQHY
jgi:hypothetical protein